jgi:hypothetical protein
MLQRRPVTRLFVALLIIYAVLMIPWPGLQGAYGALYRAAANVVFTSFGAHGEANFRALRPPDAGHDTEVTLVNRRTDFLTKTTFTLSSRYNGYAPTALLLALILATPIPWARRWRAGLWGLLLVQGFIVARLLVVLLETFTRDNDLALWELGSLGRRTVELLYHAFAGSLVAGFTVPVFIWIAVLLCRGDWRAVVTQIAVAQRPEHSNGRDRQRTLQIRGLPKYTWYKTLRRFLPWPRVPRRDKSGQKG